MHFRVRPVTHFVYVIALAGSCVRFPNFWQPSFLQMLAVRANRALLHNMCKLLHLDTSIPGEYRFAVLKIVTFLFSGSPRFVDRRICCNNRSTLIRTSLGLG